MSLKQTILPPLAATLSYSGLNSLLCKKYGGRGVILMMHGVHKDNEQPINKAGNISVSFLETILKKISQSNLSPIRLNSIPEYLNSKHNQRFVSLTFDDGYKNNLELAVPLLEKYQIPATIFVTTNGMKGTLDYEWGVLEYYLSQAETIEIDDLKLSTKSLQEKQIAYQIIAAKTLADHKDNKFKLLSLISDLNDKSYKLNKGNFLDFEGIKTLSKSSMIDIGGHTISHPMLTDLSEEDAFAEIKNNKDDLEQLLGTEIEAFAYPYGGALACSEREFEIAKKAGYKVAVTTRAGATFQEHQSHIHALPRFAVNGLYETKSMLDLYFNGSMRALKSRLGSPFVV